MIRFSMRGTLFQSGLTREGVRRKESWRSHLIVLLPILLIYASLAFYRIGLPNFWVDEVFSLRDAGSWSLLWQKAHGPLYFILLHGWINLGTSEWIARALSPLLGAVALCLCYATGVRLLNRRVAAFGTLLFATSPFFIWYSQEVRYITLMLAMSMLAIYVFSRAVDGGRFGWWLLYTVAILLAFVSFVANFFIPILQGLYLLITPSRRFLLGKWLMCLILLGICVAPWAAPQLFFNVPVDPLKPAPQQVDMKYSNFTMRSFSPMVLPYTFYTLSVGYTQGPSLRELHRSQGMAVLKPYLPRIVGLGIIFGGLFLFGLRHLWPHRDVRVFLLLWLVVPVAGALLLATTSEFIFNARYVSMILPAFLLVLSVGIASCRRALLQIVLLLVILGCNGVSLAHYYFNPHYAKADVRAALSYLNGVVKPEDRVLVIGSDTVVNYYKPAFQPTLLGLIDELPRPLDAYLRELANGAQRLWLFETREWYKDPEGILIKAAEIAFERFDYQHYPGVNIYGYSLSSASPKRSPVLTQ